MVHMYLMSAARWSRSLTHILVACYVIPSQPCMMHAANNTDDFFSTLKSSNEWVESLVGMENLTFHNTWMHGWILFNLIFLAGASDRTGTLVFECVQWSAARCVRRASSIISDPSHPIWTRSTICPPKLWTASICCHPLHPWDDDTAGHKCISSIILTVTLSLLYRHKR